MAENNSCDNDLKCKRCKNPALTGMKCINCGKTSHKSCLKILQSKQQHIKFLDDNNVVCCNDDTVSEPTDSSISLISTSNSVDPNVLKIQYLEEIIRQKDLIISNQSTAIIALKDQIVLINHLKSYENPPKLHPNESVTSKQSVNGDIAQPNKGAIKKQASAKVSNKKQTAALCDADTVNGKVPLFSGPSVSGAIQNALANRVCEDIVNLNSDIQVGGNISIHSKKSISRPKPRSILVGSMSNNDNCPIKAAPPAVVLRHFHVTNLDPSVTVDTLMSYLKQFVLGVKVIALPSRYPSNYSSFKVSVPVSDVQSILNQDIWPKDVKVNWFFLPRRPQTTASSDK